MSLRGVCTNPRVWSRRDTNRRKLKRHLNGMARVALDIVNEEPEVWLHEHDAAAADDRIDLATIGIVLSIQKIDPIVGAPLPHAPTGTGLPSERTGRLRLISLVDAHRAVSCGAAEDSRAIAGPPCSSRSRRRRDIGSPKTAHCTLSRSAWPCPLLVGQPSGPTSTISWWASGSHPDRMTA